MVNKLIKIALIGNTNAGKSTLMNSMIGKTVSIMNNKINKVRVNILGLSFKENCSDIRNSKVIDIINILRKNNIKFLTRSELFCDYSVKKCHLIKNDNKLYEDYVIFVLLFLRQ